MEADLFSASAVRDLLAVAVELGADFAGDWSASERDLAAELPPADPSHVRTLRAEIRAGGDPLGEQFCRIRSPEQRRPQGATYTPAVIVEAMLGWAKRYGQAARVVDPGAGSGRFIVQAGRAMPRAALVAVEIDPVASLLCRAHVAAAGMADRCEVKVADYRQVDLVPLGDDERTLFIGNPPYVRHHLIEHRWKKWLASEGRKLGLRPSGLAGLHVHFLVATALKARAGDLACFITSAEWLDVNYGRMVRELFINGMGGRRIVLLSPTAKPFTDADTTAAIICMEVGGKPDSVLVSKADDCAQLGALEGGRPVARGRLDQENRWSSLVRRRRKAPAGFIELGELFRAHRGQVTGANAVWVAGKHSWPLPERLLFPSITRARELYDARGELTDLGHLRSVIDIPADLDALAPRDRRMVEGFLARAREMGAHEGYVARHRKAWWSVGLREPAPILATYMARRPPAFVVNTAGARHLNIAHGLYPREPIAKAMLSRLAGWLNANVSLDDGRTYAGGLTKFEPREMERLLVPGPELLCAGTEA